MATRTWLQSLQVGDQVMILDTQTQRQYSGTVKYVLGNTVHIEEADTGVSAISSSQLAFNLQTGKNFGFLGQSYLMLVPAH